MGVFWHSIPVHGLLWASGFPRDGQKFGEQK
jgi:hypothetical protein